jgi:CRISPR/Cas system-associated exonuclease Cas4 (RecB family)
MGNQIIVIDYKFGSSRLQKHQEQLLDYMGLIREMACNKDVRGYICYIKQKQIMPVMA